MVVQLGHLAGEDLHLDRLVDEGQRPDLLEEGRTVVLLLGDQGMVVISLLGDRCHQIPEQACD